MKSSKKRIALIVTNSLGELDVFLPIITQISQRCITDIEIIFSKIELYERFLQSTDYNLICDHLNIRSSHIQFFKEFRNDKGIFYLLKWLRYLLISVVVLYKYKTIDILFSDYTDDKFIIRPLQFLTYVKSGNVFAIPHGLAIQQDTAIVDPVRAPKFVKMLCFDSKTIPFHKNYGYQRISIIGYVKAYPEWKNLLETLRAISKQPSFCVIFCRDVHENYMVKKKFEYLLISSYRAIRQVFPNIIIKYKLHPRQDAVEFDNFCLSNGFSNYTVVHGNPSLEVIGAKFAISTWSSAILDAYFNKIPCCEFFVEDAVFLNFEPEGSIYRKDGFQVFSEQTELESWLHTGPKFDIVENMEVRLEKNRITNTELHEVVLGRRG